MHALHSSVDADKFSVSLVLLSVVSKFYESWLFLKGGLLGTMYVQISRVYFLDLTKVSRNALNSPTKFVSSFLFKVKSLENSDSMLFSIYHLKIVICSSMLLWPCCFNTYSSHESLPV
jgi:hypothetical protein